MKVQVMDEVKIGIPLFADIPGGPMWFYYTARCKAEATLMAREVQRELDGHDAAQRHKGRRRGELCKRCSRCGCFKSSNVQGHVLTRSEAEGQ